MEIDLYKIHPDLRFVAEEGEILALCRSIRSHGLMEPLKIWFDGQRLRILDGEKRWRACHRLGLARIEATIAKARGG